MAQHSTSKTWTNAQMTYHRAYALKVFTSFIFIQAATSIISCPKDLGGGICPDNSKCCKISSGSSSITSGCLPNNKHVEGPGICCNDTTPFGGSTACEGNFQCARKYSVEDDENVETCVLSDSMGDVVAEMPRYNIAKAPASAISQYYGFPISPADDEAVLAYYSNLGPVLTLNRNHTFANIEIAIVIVHGSGRNADEYLHSIMTASEMQSSSSKTLVIAPRFLAIKDGVFSVPVVSDYGDDAVIMMSPMQWNDTDPIPHSFRFGANALSPFDNFSSYDAMDAIVEYLFSNVGEGERFENLRRVVIAGHSAGGQFTHRWSLTSNSLIWGDIHVDENNSNIGSESEIESGDVFILNRNIDQVEDSRMLRKEAKRKLHHIELVVVVANPRSFAFLDDRRFMNSTASASTSTCNLYEIPPQQIRDQCPTYNSWEWGLDVGGLDCPYKDKAVALFNGDFLKLAKRYSKRNVVYLAGGNDTQPLRGSCEDDWFQGPTRYVRSRNFFESLKCIFGEEHVHSRFVVDNVGHDHGLIFQSEASRRIMFGTTN